MHWMVSLWAWMALLLPTGQELPGRMDCQGSPVSRQECFGDGGHGHPTAKVCVFSPLVVQFPCDVTVSCVQGLDPKATGSVLRTGGCGVVGVAYSDQKFVVTDACYKIFRTWTVQTWCSYQPDGTTVYPSAQIDPATNRITFTSAIDSLIVQRNIGIGQRVTLRYVSSGTTEIPGMTEGDVYSLVRVSDSTFAVAYNTTKQEPVDITGTGVGPHLFRYANSELGLPLNCGQLQQYPFENWYSACCNTGQQRAWQDDGDGYFRFTQVIKVIDDMAPQWVDCSDLTFCHEQSDCGLVAVALTGLAEDECTPQGQLKYSWQLDLYADGTVNATGASADASGAYPPGTHKITFKVTDQCGNWSTCTRFFTILDCKKPTPVCLHNLSVSLMDTPDGGMAEVRATSLEAGESMDNCTRREDLLILVERASLLQPGQAVPGPAAGESVLVDCDDLPPNTMSPWVEVAVWVGDQAGNWAYCLTSIWVQDNMGVCASGNLTSVLAQVRTAGEEEMTGVRIEVEGDVQGESITNVLGFAWLGDLPLGGSVLLRARKEGDPLDGVTALDLSLLEGHLLGIRPIRDPYLQIAADINDDGRISFADLMALRRAILEPASAFQGRPAWRFVDAEYVFHGSAAPGYFPEFRELQSLEHGQFVRFIAVKRGDIRDETASGAQPEAAVRELSAGLQLLANDQVLEPGQQVQLRFRAGAAMTLAAGQFALSVDPSLLALEDVFSEAAGSAPFHFGMSRREEGLITACWHGAMPMELNEEDVLFTLHLRAVAGGSLSRAVRLSPEPLPALAYDATLQPQRVALQWERERTVNGIAVSVFPNPFTGETSLEFSLDREEDVVLRVTDLSGKTIYRQRALHPAGQVRVPIRREDLGATGIYGVQLSAGAMHWSGKVVLID
jgi:hypothetical protein